ncbi:TVP38/TMEM64 family protein [Sulfitobacter sp. LCG007]
MTQNPKPRAADAMRRNLPLILIAIAAGLGFLLLRDTLDFETLRNHRDELLDYRDAHYVLTALAYVALYTVIVGLSLPGATVSTLTGGFLFGTAMGAFLSVVGATLGATVIFLAARHGPGERLRRRMDASDGAVRRIKRGLDENQWSMLFFIRLAPLVPFFVANLIPAFLGVPLRRFAISTFFGIIPGALVYASVGAGLGAVFESGGTPDPGLILEPRILVPLLALAALSLLPVLIRSLPDRKETGQ